MCSTPPEHQHFNPRSPHGERPEGLPTTWMNGEISIHAPRTGSDAHTVRFSQVSYHFNPRSPHGERHNQIRVFASHGHFNPRSPHGERRVLSQILVRQLRISIHAPRTGSDVDVQLLIQVRNYFNPRSPHGERLTRRRACTDAPLFQSTLPARGATYLRGSPALPAPISIHAPRTGSDQRAGRCRMRRSHFNPRSPHGERRYSFARRDTQRDFNPRSPHGERQELQRFVEPLLQFQSTLPARGATIHTVGVGAFFAISIHAPRTGSDG